MAATIVARRANAPEPVDRHRILRWCTVLNEVSRATGVYLCSTMDLMLTTLCYGLPAACLYLDESSYVEIREQAAQPVRRVELLNAPPLGEGARDVVERFVGE